MTEAIAKGTIFAASDYACPTVNEVDAKVAVLKLTGAIGRDDPISERVVRQFARALGDAERLHLIVNSEGGKVDEADRIYRILRTLPLPISAEVHGRAWSAAVTILLAADFRWARAGATILIHRTRAEFAGWLTAPQLIEQAQRLRTSDDNEADLLAFRTGFDRNWFVREQASEDLLSDNQAILCGLLHAIEGKVPFSVDNLAALDRMHLAGVFEDVVPSKMLAANYRAAGAVAAMCRETAAESTQMEKL
jgi:ATP-dependent protease ClpP protease subunit